mmetsp:Transcript_4060/g.6294  ORF Transcript_4060/g.6294 Transcript_4060/m.6294 type:complete len:344 (+) Transcript_4060:141-1172(+)|eukprot:CAMPEP_0185039656 /NCGR_PEP_ID=MMETSP1103-20130426/36743_1 /TAXON_ID=36769 /ORGANISM="Paraphysomonas bandaiensis, Strain Caron Lab Isolate" /LENGTH=343 /DNA_ID=CAMNT_0027578633 /DNA_START=125 /DNA_END=1156 /DNA_ORIENTATION=-
MTDSNEHESFINDAPISPVSPIRAVYSTSFHQPISDDSNIYTSFKDSARCILPEYMQKYSVKKVVGRYTTAYNLYTCSGEFLLSCLCSESAVGLFFFSTLQNAHKKRLEDIPNISTSNSFVGSMCQGGDMGYDFIIRDSQNYELAMIRYSSSCVNEPISFDIILPDELSITSSPATSPILRHLWTDQHRKALLNETALQQSQRLLLSAADGVSSLLGNAAFQYQQVCSTESSSVTCIRLGTKAPSYNSEFKSWMLNFGGRAKLPAHENFVIVSSTEGDEDGLTSGRLVINVGRSAGERIAMVHTKEAADCYAIEVRGPFSLQVALGVSCAAFAGKGLGYLCSI